MTEIPDLTADASLARTRVIAVSDPTSGQGTYKATLANVLALTEKADVGLGNVENTALSTWAGTANITTLGTITTGTWQGTAIADAYIASASDWNAVYNAVATPGQFLGFVSGNIAAVDGTQVKNLLINGDFIIAQLGTSFDSTTTPDNDDDTYQLDMWNLISDGADSCDITQETSDLPTGARSAIKLEAETANQQFGIVQIVENGQCAEAIGDAVSLSFKIKGSGLAEVRCAILAWDSTADAVTSDVVGSWNGGGTEPTWATNWTREGDLIEVTSMASWTEVTEANIAIDTASAANIAIVFWVDDTTITAGDYVLITDVMLTPGALTVPFVREDMQVQLQKCQRYLDPCIIQAMKANSASNCQVSLRHNNCRITPTAYRSYEVILITDATAADYTQSAINLNTTHDKQLRAGRVSMGNFSGMSSGVVMVPRYGTVWADARL